MTTGIGVDAAWRRLPQEERCHSAAEFAAVVGAESEVTTFTYSMVGLQAGADLLLWSLASSLDALVERSASVPRAGMGKWTVVTESFLGIVQPSQYVKKPTPQEQSLFSGERSRYLIAETERRQPFFFRSVRAAKDPAKYDFSMRDVARSTSAAPTFFPPHKIATTSSYYFSLVDGGVFANNPGMCAYADALAEIGPSADVIMVSLGTGSLTRPVQYDNIKSWGELKWVQPVIEVMMDGVSNATDYHLEQILGTGNYYRIQATLDIAKDEMDDASPTNVRNLELQAEDLIRSSEDTLAKICERLTRAS